MKVSEARAVIQAVVQAHATHNTFLSVWNEVKEKPTEPDYPIVVWDQWRSRLIDREVIGFVRLIQIRLMLVTSVATDRTAEERDEAVEAADDAAADIILSLQDDYDWNISDVSTTTQFDENSKLETGVFLTFTVETDALCLDADAFLPVTVNGVEYGSPTVHVVDQDGDQVGSLEGGQWVVDTDGTTCPTECEVLGAITDPLTVAGCVTDEMAIAMGGSFINRDAYTADLLVEQIGNAGKSEEVCALLCTAEPVSIVDQDNNVLETVEAGGTYQVLVLTSIDGTAPYDTPIIIDGTP